MPVAVVPEPLVPGPAAPPAAPIAPPSPGASHGASQETPAPGPIAPPPAESPPAAPPPPPPAPGTWGDHPSGSALDQACLEAMESDPMGSPLGVALAKWGRLVNGAKT
jgi:hypothetical protein